MPAKSFPQALVAPLLGNVSPTVAFLTSQPSPNARALLAALEAGWLKPSEMMVSASLSDRPALMEWLNTKPGGGLRAPTQHWPVDDTAPWEDNLVRHHEEQWCELAVGVCIASGVDPFSNSWPQLPKMAAKPTRIGLVSSAVRHGWMSLLDQILRHPSAKDLNKYSAHAYVSFHRESDNYLSGDTLPIPLVSAAVVGDRWDIAQRLLDAGLDINARDLFGRTALFYAKDVAMVKHLIAAGADVSIVDKKGMSASTWWGALGFAASTTNPMNAVLVEALQKSMSPDAIKLAKMPDVFRALDACNKTAFLSQIKTLGIKSDALWVEGATTWSMLARAATNRFRPLLRQSATDVMLRWAIESSKDNSHQAAPGLDDVELARYASTTSASIAQAWTQKFASKRHTSTPVDQWQQWMALAHDRLLSKKGDDEGFFATRADISLLVTLTSNILSILENNVGADSKGKSGSYPALTGWQGLEWGSEPADALLTKSIHTWIEMAAPTFQSEIDQPQVVNLMEALMKEALGRHAQGAGRSDEMLALALSVFQAVGPIRYFTFLNPGHTDAAQRHADLSNFFNGVHADLPSPDPDNRLVQPQNQAQRLGALWMRLSYQGVLPAKTRGVDALLAAVEGTAFSLPGKVCRSALLDGALPEKSSASRPRF